MALLALRDFHAGYGDLEIVSGVDLDVGAGEYVTIIGPNGAGKSTLLNGVFGLADRLGGASSSTVGR